MHCENRKREVALVISDHFPEPIDNPSVVEEIRQRTGECLTVAAVRSARRQIQDKLYPLLKQHMNLGE